jgi:hypothetical protein
MLRSADGSLQPLHACNQQQCLWPGFSWQHAARGLHLFELGLAGLQLPLLQVSFAGQLWTFAGILEGGTHDAEWLLQAAEAQTAAGFHVAVCIVRHLHKGTESTVCRIRSVQLLLLLLLLLVLADQGGDCK